MTTDDDDDEAFLKAIRTTGVASDLLLRDCARVLVNTDDRPWGWESRCDHLRQMSVLARQICDQLTIAEDIVKRCVPPECDLRVRREPRSKRCKAGLIEGMTMSEKGWLSLAAANGHVLEIKMLENEWPNETAARFARACSATPAEYLVQALAASPPTE